MMLEGVLCHTVGYLWGASVTQYGGGEGVSFCAGAFFGLFFECCFTSTETVGLLGTGAQDVHLDFTQLLSAEAGFILMSM